MSAKAKATKKPLAETYERESFIAECGSKSAAIRRLHAERYSNGEIAKFLGIIYQFVYNVLKNDELKKLAAKNK